MKRVRPVIDDMLAAISRIGVKPEGLFGIYAQLRKEHPEWEDSQIREASVPLLQAYDRKRFKRFEERRMA